MTIDRNKYRNVVLDVGITAYGIGSIAYAAYMLKEPVKALYRKYKLKRLVKKLTKYGNELLVTENECLKNENEKLIETNRKLIEQIPKTKEEA